MTAHAQAAQPILTDAHREYLRANAQRDVLLYDFVSGFMEKFHLNPTAAGQLVAAWIKETC